MTVYSDAKKWRLLVEAIGENRAEELIEGTRGTTPLSAPTLVPLCFDGKPGCEETPWHCHSSKGIYIFQASQKTYGQQFQGSPFPPSE